MIIKNNKEVLVDAIGNKNIFFDGLVNKAVDMDMKWQDDIAVYDHKNPVLRMTPDGSLTYLSSREGGYVTHNLTEYTLNQICDKAGVPASYIGKCFESEMGDLAVSNLDAWSARSKNLEKNYIVRHYNDADDADHAVLTTRYNGFSSGQIMESLHHALNDSAIAGRYEANQAFLSPDHLHVRFVDFNDPLTIGGDQLYAGFTVSSSDIGRGALVMKYFLYRFACRNGIVRAKGRLGMFRRTHLESFEDISGNLFLETLKDIDDITAMSMLQIEKSMQRKLTAKELEDYLKRAQQDLHFGKTGRENIHRLMDSVYGNTYWGFINAITEDAQRYTLTDRIASETFAGRLLEAA